MRNDNLEKGRLKCKANREAKLINPFYIKINDTYRVSTDSYNIVLSKKLINEKDGSLFASPISYFCTFKYLIEFLRSENKITIAEAETFLNKVSKFKISYKNGKLIVSHPKDYIFDVNELK